jgi:hypothetical protein
MSKVGKPKSTPPRFVAAGDSLTLHAWLERISPMIWRRLRVRGDSSLADLHAWLQIAFEWDDHHLHRFRIHGREFGLYRDGGIWFDTDAREVRLSDLALRLNERFLYEYDFTAGWQVTVRVEKIEPASRLPHPRCIGGQGIVPPEHCCGPEHFLSGDATPPLGELLAQGAEIVKRFLETGERPTKHEAEELRWLQPRRVFRRVINQQLSRYALAASIQATDAGGDHGRSASARDHDEGW